MSPARVAAGAAFLLATFAVAVTFGGWLYARYPGLWIVYVLAWVAFAAFLFREHRRPVEPRHPVRTARHR